MRIPYGTILLVLATISAYGAGIWLVEAADDSLLWWGVAVVVVGAGLNFLTSQVLEAYGFTPERIKLIAARRAPPRCQVSASVLVRGPSRGWDLDQSLARTGLQIKGDGRTRAVTWEDCAGELRSELDKDGEQTGMTVSLSRLGTKASRLAETLLELSALIDGLTRAMEAESLDVWDKQLEVAGLLLRRPDGRLSGRGIMVNNESITMTAVDDEGAGQVERFVLLNHERN